MNKIPVTINFAAGLDLKTDPFQLQPGKFLSLQNSIFTKQGLMQKRNGYDLITTASGSSTVTTFSGNLVIMGNESLAIYSPDIESSINTGFLQSLSLSTQPIVRTATGQLTCDLVIASNGLACSTWLDSDTNSYYQISDAASGQAIVPKIMLPSTATSSRAFVLGNYFIVAFLVTVSAATHLQYIAIPFSSPSTPKVATDLGTSVASLSSAWNGCVANNTLYVFWQKSTNTAYAYLSASLSSSTPGNLFLVQSTLYSVTADTTGNNPVIWMSAYLPSINTIVCSAWTNALAPIMSVTTLATSVTINQITSTAANSVANVFYEIANTYSYTPNAKSDYIEYNTMTLSGSTGTAGTPSTILRSVGLASKAIFLQGKSYMLATYGGAYQPTYFLIDDSGNIISKLAYQNGGGYAYNQVLPTINQSGTSAQPILSVAYLFKDLLAAANSQGNMNAAGITPSPSSVYTQTGINLVNFTFNSLVYSAEIGRGLHVGAGFLWQFDGVKPVEHNFHVWPEDITAVWSSSGGSIHAQPDGSTNTNAYYYQVCYEWTDGQGLPHRSSPSIPVSVTTTGSGTSGSITVNVPYARLTYKTTNKIRIVIYRWSVAQQAYYRVTSITSPQLNSTTSDSLAFVDTLADSSIIGNDLIYTTGGVIGNTGSPSFNAIALFDDRLWGINAEDPNSLWFSKQVLEGTPVEMSPQFTLYVAPSTGTTGSTGEVTALFPMDDKLIIFKEDAIYYINGTGPTITGIQNGYNGPIFITSSVGTVLPNSIALIPQGLMFQSDKGIWLLGRDVALPTYIGAPVENFNNQTVTSAITIPGTNQVRFTLDSNITLMFDYYFQQWGTFSNVNAISSCIWQGLHTYLNKYGQILQETPGKYLDISNPVLLQFTTSWLNMAGLSGYERVYDFMFLGTYVSPHYLNVQVAYDYSQYPQQQSVIAPNNYTGNYGSDQLYGQTTPYGGPSSPFNGTGNLEQWRIHTQKQTCESFQISIQEVYNPAFGNLAGAGFTMSGINCTVGLKKGRRPIRATNTAG